jgi:hypothetical protein
MGPCPICGRSLIAGKSVNEHHLVPRSLKGKPEHRVTLHTICHNKIHSVFTERELLSYYHTVDRIVTHPEIVKFVTWVRKKDPEFRSRNRSTRAKIERKAERRRANRRGRS